MINNESVVIHANLWWALPLSLLYLCLCPPRVNKTGGKLGKKLTLSLVTKRDHLQHLQHEAVTLVCKPILGIHEFVTMIKVEAFLYFLLCVYALMFSISACTTGGKLV